MFLRRLKPYIFANRFVLSNRFLQKRLSALAYDIDYQYENQYIKYDFETVPSDSFTNCKYCKGIGYVECILCKDGCSQCHYTGFTPCPMCNSKENIIKKFPLFIEGNLK